MNTRRYQAVRWIVAAFRSIRESRGMSQMDLARAMHSAQSWICDLETGRRADPVISTLIRVAMGLELEMTMTITNPRTGEILTIPLTGAGAREVD